MAILQKYMFSALICTIFTSCACFPGLFYPKIIYKLSTVESGYLVSLKDRCETGRNLSNIIAYDFSQPANSFSHQIHAIMLLDQPFKELRIVEIVLNYGGKKFSLVKDRKYIIDTSRYYTDGRFYSIWINNLSFSPIRLNKIFKDKKIGDIFSVSVDTVFSFEDGIEHEEHLEYKVLLINNWIYFPDK